MKLLRTIALMLSVLVLIGLCAVLFILNNNASPAQTDILSESLFTLESAVSSQSIKPFSASGAKYLFIPSCTRSLRFDFKAHHAEVDGKTFYPGDSLEEASFSGVHSFVFFNASGDEFERDEMEFIVSGHIPAVFIATASGRYSAQTDKLHKEYCSIEIVNPDGTDEYSNIHPYSDLIRGHGNSSWRDSEKRSYNLYLQFSSDLFGMGEADEWVMLANALDDTGIRNKLVYDYASEIGLSYSPESVFVDVYFDGLYHGTYQLCEKLQSGEERIDIGNDGILFSMEVGMRLAGKDSEHITERGQRLVRLEPEANNGRWAERFVSTVDSFEDYIYTDFTLDGLKNYIDLPSWAKMGIIEELFSDLDAWTTSQYFYIPSDSNIIFAGPVWDFDTSSGKNSGTLSFERTDAVNLINYRCDTNYLGEETPWFYRLMQNRAFYDYVREVFAQEICPGFNSFVESSVNTCYDTLGASRKANALRWSLSKDKPEEHLKDFLAQRLAFFKRIWIDCEPFYSVTYKDTGVSLAYFETEECPADLYYYKWFFDSEHTRCAKPFVPERDTVLYAETDEPYPR